MSLVVMSCSNEMNNPAFHAEQPNRLPSSAATKLQKRYVIDDTPPPYIAEWIFNDRVFFAKGSAQLDQEAEGRLEKQASWLKCHYPGRLTVEGHADARGSHEFNIVLAERRAAAVKRYLIERGLQPTSIRTISYGKGRPVALGDGEAAWKENRRVVITLDDGEISPNCKL